MMKPVYLITKTILFTILINFKVVLGENLKENVQLSPIVNTKYGKVQGVKSKDHYEFRKIPFAKPPIKNLRYKVPEEPNSWNDVLVTKEFSDFCIQYNVFWNTTEGIEDCLYLSVFTPTLPEESERKEKLPVMFYIHSGGFMFGRGSQFRADYLMETKRVVAVVFQYRLGSFGFLNTEDEQSFGNMGMKDQVMALNWVHNNIEAFGGDPSRVMIFGTSAGAASVHYQILSPLSKGKFHGAFSGSGTALCPWGFQPKPRENALRLGKLLNCPTDNTKVMVDCLREKDADEIGFTHSKFLEWYADPIAAFGPSLEKGNPDLSTHFIHKHPADLINDGVVNEVPWILGFNSDEGYEHSMSIFKSEKLLKQLNEKWKQLFPITLEYVHESPEEKAEITEKVREFYFKNQPVCEENLKNLSNAYSDKTYVLCTLRSAYRHARLGKTKTHPIYLFQFDYKGESSIVTLKGYPRDGFGSNHMDDIQYLVNSPLFKFIDEKSKDKPFQKSYADMIITFAETGKIPAFSDDRPEDIWQPLDPGGNIKWYHVTEQPKMEPMSQDFSSRITFWESFNLQEYAVSESNQPRDEL